MTPATAIRAIRSAAGLSQAALAERIGAPQSSVSAWEAGRWLPDARAVARLCALADDDGAALLAALRGALVVLEGARVAGGEGETGGGG